MTEYICRSCGTKWYTARNIPTVKCDSCKGECDNNGPAKPIFDSRLIEWPPKGSAITDSEGPAPASVRVGGEMAGTNH